MPRSSLGLAVAVALVAFAAAAADLDPHLDPRVVPGGCQACHEGHGASRSPMLPTSQKQTCLRCHDSTASANEMVFEGKLAADARPQLLQLALTQVSVHPMSDSAYSRHELDVVTCSSCHSPHRSPVRPDVPSRAITGERRASPKNPARFEYELCGDCHGIGGRPEGKAVTLVDIGRLLSSTNRSFHPIEAPSAERSPSVPADLAGRFVNCTDCHGSSDPDGPQGPHGSANLYLLVAAYSTADGSDESHAAYALCYRCHDRDAVLANSTFPQHRQHIEDLKASCATCHSAHGSVENRALIRFGEETIIGGVSRSAATGTIAYISDGPGSGACFLTCHDVDHGPEAYGPMQLMFEMDREGLRPRPAGVAIPNPQRADTPDR